MLADLRTGAPVFDGLLIGVFATAVVTFAVLMFITAPYGRHERAGWGPQIDTRLAWVIMEAPASLGFAWFFLAGPVHTGLVPWTLFALWQLHYAHRAFLYPFQLRLRPGTGTPLLTAALGALFSSVNGYLNGSFISSYAPHLTAAWMTDPRFITGILLFFYGYFLNKQSDRILRDLRRPGETGYKIPYGGGYRFVSSPNYLGELLTWTGFAVAAWSPAGLAFVAFTAANLVPRALANHKWYKEKFPDYPPERRALLPFVL